MGVTSASRHSQSLELLWLDFLQPALAPSPVADLEESDPFQLKLPCQQDACVPSYIYILTFTSIAPSTAEVPKVAEGGRV